MTVSLYSPAIRPELQYLTNMMRSRECDRREGLLVRQGAGLFHVGAAGHEALSGLADSMQPEDLLFPYYRDRPLAMARGYSVTQIAQDFYATAASSSNGTNLPGHYSSRALNIYPVATPTGSQCLPAVGAAWALKLNRGNGLVLTTIGEAATREGEYYEAVCFAVQHKLPVLFVVEDNGFGISTRTDSMSPLNLGIFNPTLYSVIDATDFDVVLEAGRRAMAEIREGSGPTILWCRLDRLCSHTSSDDQAIYRTAQELTEIGARDPISRYRDRLIDSGHLSLDTWAEMDSAVTVEIEDAYRQAASGASPNRISILSNLFGESALPISTLTVTAETMVAGLNQTLRKLLQQDARFLLFGQDIEDPKGGVFGFTKGLSAEFPDRVINSPLAEATIVGAGIGLASLGSKPIFEIQFVDFIAPAYQQLSAQAATLRWRSGGEWDCPLIIYAPYGAYLPSGGPWHSQSNEALLAHIPGIRIGIPSCPFDVVDLFEAAAMTNDPVVILMPKHIMRMRFESAIPGSTRLGFGVARLVSSGDDLTVVTWGNTVDLAKQAGEVLRTQGISIDLIDLRTIVPCDWETLTASLEKTGRLLVVQEDNRTCGFGQNVIAETVANERIFERLLSPPLLLARPDTHIPFHPGLEESLLPSVDDIIRACRELCGEAK